MTAQNRSEPRNQRHRVVVIGGGFGGLAAVRSLKHAEVDVTLVDRTGYHLFQPLLYQVATGLLSEGQVAWPLRDLLHRQTNAQVVIADVHDIDVSRRVIRAAALEEDVELPYDSLIVAAGAGYSYFGHDHIAARAPGLKTVEDALQIRSMVFSAFDRAEQATDETRRRHHLTFAVVGGGPTGIELAGQIRDLAHSSLCRRYRNFDPDQTRVVLLEAGSQLLPTYGERLSQSAARGLASVGVDVQLGAFVEDVDARGVHYRQGGHERLLEASVTLWAAGVTAAPLARILTREPGVQANSAGQIHITPECTLPGHPEVFVIGDLMGRVGVPGVAQLAIQSGRYAAEVIRRRLGGHNRPEPFSYHDKGSLATIARFRAVARLRHTRLRGLPAWMLWLLVHLVTLVGFRRRLTTALYWTFAFTTGWRPERYGLSRAATITARTHDADGSQPPTHSNQHPPAPIPATTAPAE